MALPVAWWVRMVHQPTGEERWVMVHIPPQATCNQALELLADSGLVRFPRATAWWARVRGLDRRIQAGAYLLSPSMTPDEILHRLAKGLVAAVSVTIPEGSTIRDIASLLQLHAGIDSAAFVAHCRSESLLQALGVHASSLEGYLFPDTYRLTPGASPAQVASLMVSRLREVMEGISWDEELVGLTLHQILTLASIVEKETAVSAERPKVAAVYLNRLAMGMKLDADPTVAYGLDKVGARLSWNDLKIPTPYNTYLNRGLPPGPICSPGLGSIQAVLHPDRSCDALYFVAKGDGTHHFSRTFGEHRHAVQYYRRGIRLNEVDSTGADSFLTEPPPG